MRKNEHSTFNVQLSTSNVNFRQMTSPGIPVAMTTSNSDEWPTPKRLFDALDREFGFTLDPCSTHGNAKCRRHFTKSEDGLSRSWGQHVVFMNPPYGRQIGRWLEKAARSAQEGATVVCLVPARTDTVWWHSYCMNAEIRFIQGRLRFIGAKSSAPFPSAIVVMRKRQRVCRIRRFEYGH